MCVPGTILWPLRLIWWPLCEPVMAKKHLMFWDVVQSLQAKSALGCLCTSLNISMSLCRNVLPLSFWGREQPTFPERYFNSSANVIWTTSCPRLWHNWGQHCRGDILSMSLCQLLCLSLKKYKLKFPNDLEFKYWGIKMPQRCHVHLTNKPIPVVSL